MQLQLVTAPEAESTVHAAAANAARWAGPFVVAAAMSAAIASTLVAATDPGVPSGVALTTDSVDASFLVPDVSHVGR